MKHASSTKTFTLARFIEHLAHVAATVDKKAALGVRDGADLIFQEARSEISHYQSAAGPFPEWAPLAESTLEGWTSPHGVHHPGKIELGYAPPDNPLLREGDLRDSIEMSYSGNEAAVGSNSDIAVDQELGTRKIPARSFLGRAGFLKAEEVANTIGEAVVDAIMGRPHQAPKPKEPSEDIPF